MLVYHGWNSLLDGIKHDIMTHSQDIVYQGFVALVPLKFGTRWLCSVGGCPGHCRMFCNTPGVYSLHASYENDKCLFSSVQFSSVAQSCPTLCGPMNHSTSGLPVYHQLPEFTQTHVHRVRDAIQLSHPLSSPSPPAPNPSQHQGLFQWVNSSHEVAKVLEFQLQHQSFQ